MRNADRGGFPFYLDVELHVASMLIDCPIGTRSIENDRSFGNVPSLKTKETAVAGDLVFQDELEYQIALEIEMLRDNHPHQTETDRNACLVIHGTAAVDHISL